MNCSKTLGPCVLCDRVTEPEKCDNKNCGVWRQWALGRWEMIRGYIRWAMDHSSPEPVGVPLGGRYYAAPHQVEAYLHNDPCKACLCPKDLCGEPCQVRRHWEHARKEVYQ